MVGHRTGVALKIRKLAPEDMDACARVFLEARRQAFHWVDPARFRLEDFPPAIAGEEVWVAAIGERIVGFVSVYLPDDFLHHLFVAPCDQARGVGSSLLRAALDRIGRPAELKCLCANRRACAFYEKRGWLEVERSQDELGPYVRYRKLD